MSQTRHDIGTLPVPRHARTRGSGSPFAARGLTRNSTRPRSCACAVLDPRSEMSPVIVFRVRFSGPLLSDEAMDALTAAGVAWEGSEHGPEEPARHRALVETSTEPNAINTVAGLLEAHGSFGNFSASPVTNSRGERWRGPIRNSWDQIDWHSEPKLARLRDPERAVLFSLADDGEPTWLVAGAVSVDRSSAEAMLEGLQEQGLVYSDLLEAWEPGKEDYLDRWWAITDEGWDLLGLIKSPGYNRRPGSG